MKAHHKESSYISWSLMVVVLLVLVSLAPLPVRPQGGCKDCARTAYLNQVTTNAADPNFRTSVKYLMWQTLISNCFHFMVEGNYVPKQIAPNFGAGKRPPEYYFDVNYAENLGGTVKSRLTIDMYFVGPPEEKVITWVTEGDRPTQHFRHYHMNRMFLNPHAVLEPYRPLEETVLENFEKRPTQCLVKPSKKTVAPGEEIEVVINGIEHAKGQRSREFNRIIVHAVEGKIIGGQPLLVDQDLKAFKVGNGEVKFTYKAPTSGSVNEDTIRVYSACDILPDATVPMAKTTMKDKIAEEKIEIGKAKTQGTITIRRIVTTHRTSNSPSHSSSEEGTSQVNATIQASFAFERLYVPRDKDEMEERYAVKSWDILDASANDNDKKEDEWRDKSYFQGLKERTVKVETGSYKVSKSDLGPEGLTIFLDKRTGKAKNVVLYFHALALSGQLHITTDSVFGDQGYKTSYACYTRSRHISSDEFQPPGVGLVEVTNHLTASVAEAIQSGGMPEGTKVTGGDGVHQLSGGSTVKFPETIPGETQEYTFTWQITRVPPATK